MEKSLQTHWRGRYATALASAGCSLLLDPTGRNVAETCYCAGALDVLALLAQSLDGEDADLLVIASDLYDEADGRLATLDATREPRLIGGPCE